VVKNFFFVLIQRPERPSSGDGLATLSNSRRQTDGPLLDAHFQSKTFPNAILEAISDTDDRILTIEDTPELQCAAPNHVAFFIQEDIGFTWKQAVKDALRTRPDRIVVGEVRDAAALDLLKAWNTGHNGGCATLHANSAKRGLTRMESLIKEAVPVAPVHLIAEAIDLIIFIEGTATGRDVSTDARVLHRDGDDYVLEEIPSDDTRSIEDR
jgi:type IV secretion system protein VirB11